MTSLDDPEERFPELAAAGKPMPPDAFPTLWLDNPSQRNALVPEDLRQVAHYARNESLFSDQVLVLAGRGPVFCAGFDLKACQADPGVLTELLHYLSTAIRALRARERPVVIAAHGAAIAGGCALLSGGDYAVADRSAKFGYPVVRLGLSPAVSAPFLRFSMPPGPCRRLLLDPGLIDGAEAYRLGLVHELVERPEDVLPAALRAARGLADKPPHALAATSAWLREIDAAHDAASDAIDDAARPAPSRHAAGTSRPDRGLAASLATAASDECAAALAALRL